MGDRIIADGLIDGIDLTGRTGTIKNVEVDESIFEYAIEFDEELPDGRGHECSGKTKDKYGRWSRKGDKFKLLENKLETNQNKNMSNIVTFVKNLTLSKEEKLLREMGLKDSCGDYTSDAREIAINKLLDDSQAHLIDVATQMKAEKKANKDCKTCE